MAEFDGVPLDDLVLTSARLTLRPWRSEDAPDVLAAVQDPLMHAYLPLPDPYTAEVARSFVEQDGNAGRAAGTSLAAAVVETSSGRLAGAIEVRFGGSIGYWLAAPFRGNGYAAEATRLLTEWALAHGVRRVELDCDLANIASARTALAAGFAFEGCGWDLAFGPPERERRFDAARFARLAGDAGAPITPRFPRLRDDDLTDTVVALRPIRPADTDAAEESDDELTLGWAFSPAKPSRTDVERRCARAELDWLVGSAARMTIVDVTSGRYAGEISLRLAGPPGVGGIGYVVHPSFRGRGYTSRALRLLAPWAFDAAGFGRLELGAKAGNLASQRAAAHAGFEPEGTRSARLRNHDGSYSDEVRFVLLSPTARRS